MTLRVLFAKTSKCIGRRCYYTYTTEVSQPIKGKEPRFVQNAAEAFCCLDSCMTIVCHGSAATPNTLLCAMTEVGKKKCLKNIMVCHITSEGPAPYAQPDCKEIFRSNSFFMGGNVRKAVAEGRGDNVSIFLSEIPLVFTKGLIKPDMTLVTLSPPDRHGYCSLGTSVDFIRSALLHTKMIIAQINKQMPRTFGSTMVHLSHIDFAICIDEPIPAQKVKPPKDDEMKIGKYIAENLVKDGATLQLGIGNIPDAVLAQLLKHKDLGVHSEMFADGVVDLMQCGCITNNRKKTHRGRIVGSFLKGSKRLYDFVNDNPAIEMLEVEYVNNTKIIAQLPNMTAINSCVEIDLTGQVSSDSIGPRFFSGFGGQVDFIRGAAESYDGLGVPIIALTSITKKKESKIVPMLKHGAGVVTTRGHVHYVVTEYGIAYLFGKNMRQRAHALIKIAHPDHREKLEKAACERLKIKPSP